MTKLLRVFIPAALYLTLCGAAQAGKESAADWFAKCNAQAERLFGDELKKVKLTAVRSSDVIIRVAVADEIFIFSCRMDRERDEVIAYRFKDMDWQEVRLSANRS